jgi:hypothetical protein
MAKQLDKTKSYGVICGTGDSDAFDRAPHYEQNGKLYDAAGILITPGGEPLKRKPVAPRKPELSPLGTRAPADADAIRSPGELLQRSDELPLRKFRERAQVILAELGEPPCPPTASREQIEEQLAEILNAHRGLYR